MLVYCHIANATLAPLRSQNTIPSFGAFRIVPSDAYYRVPPTTRSNHDQSMAKAVARAAREGTGGR